MSARALLFRAAAVLDLNQGNSVRRKSPLRCQNRPLSSVKELNETWGQFAHGPEGDIMPFLFFDQRGRAACTD